MPPRKKQKTELEQQLGAFMEVANNEYVKAKRDKDYITLFKFRQLVKKLDLEFDDDLLTEDDHQDGISNDRFVELIDQVKREHDLSRLVDYIYGYLQYEAVSAKSSEGVTFENFLKALRTLPKTPKRIRVIENAYCFANNGTVDDSLSRNDLVRILRRTQFFQKHYQEGNTNESFYKEDKQRGLL